MLSTRKYYIKIVAKLMFLLTVAVCCIASYLILENGDINYNAKRKVLENDDSASDPSLKSFDSHIIEKLLCTDKQNDICNSCSHMEDSIQKHPRPLGFDLNLELIKQEIEREKTNSTQPTKIVLLGDSITEQWNGRLSGIFKDGWKQYKTLFDQKFNDGALALGVSGDTFAWLHWRIRHGEVPDELNPKIWWIHIGTNDIKFYGEEARIILGIMHIVEEIREMKPNAIIVVNAILPCDDKLDSKNMKIRQIINDGLRLSVDGLEDKNIYYFDALHAFFDESSQNKIEGLHIGSVHLSIHGYYQWATEIIKWTKERLDIDLTE